MLLERKSEMNKERNSLLRSSDEKSAIPSKKEKSALIKSEADIAFLENLRLRIFNDFFITIDTSVLFLMYAADFENITRYRIC